MQVEELKQRLRITTDPNEIIALTCNIKYLIKSDGKEVCPKTNIPSKDDFLGLMKSSDDVDYINNMDELVIILNRFRMKLVENNDMNPLLWLIGHWIDKPSLELFKVKKQGNIMKMPMNKKALEFIEDQLGKRAVVRASNKDCDIVNWINHIKKKARDLEDELFGKHNHKTTPIIARFIIEAVMCIKNEYKTGVNGSTIIDLEKTIKDMYNGKPDHWSEYRDNFVKQMKRLGEVAQLELVNPEDDEDKDGTPFLFPLSYPGPKSKKMMLGFLIPDVIGVKSVSVDTRVVRELYKKSDLLLMSYLVVCEALDKYASSGKAHGKYYINKEGKFELNKIAQQYAGVHKMKDIAVKIKPNINDAVNKPKQYAMIHDAIMKLDKCNYVRVEIIDDDAMMKNMEYRFYAAAMDGEREWEAGLKQIA